MKIQFKDYIVDLSDCLLDLEVTDKKKKISLEKALSETKKLILKCKNRKRRLVFIGNGGSASIAGHQAIDYAKSANIEAVSFNEPSLLTCLSNDYGYPNVFKKAVELYGKCGDILIAISSSGRSKNIINAVKQARRQKLCSITFSGFDKKNDLRKLGDINYYVPSHSYGVVEISHLTILHFLLDCIFCKS